MQTFLDKTAQYLSEHFNNDFENVCVVLPNRRASLFLKKNLAKYLDKTTWAPTVYSIEDFIFEASGLQKSDRLSLLFELYQIHVSLQGENAQTFESFLNWGHIIIQDFNEIDQYLVDAKEIFSFLSDTKALVVWNLNLKPLTDYEKDYISFYNSLYDYYTLLTKKLFEKKMAYQGMVYRKVANEIENISFDYEKIIFAGFNALTHAEEKILKYLVKTKKAEILWDADNYCLENPIQEAGKFIRSHVKNFKPETFRWKSDHFASGSKNIHITGVSQNIGQVKLTGQILKNLASEKKDDHHTAIVLSDESLLLPLLNSLPENISEYNVTMGLPLKNTPIYELFEGIILLHENSEKRNGSFYYKDLLRVLDHFYISKLFQKADQDILLVRQINQSIRKSNRVYYTLKNLEDSFNNNAFDIGAISFLLSPKDYQPQNIIKILLNLVKALKEIYQGENDPKESKAKLIEMEYLFHFAKVLNRLMQILIENEFVSNIRTLRKLFSLISASVSIPFYGEPLKGIQVMGMLETRTLDFKNIIVLSVNEGIIPSGKTQNSFVPFDIKIKFKLPTYREKDAIFAYHFYRLLQCAEDIQLMYNTQSDSIGGGDKSRFITQLLHEMPAYNAAISIEEKMLSVPPIMERSHYNIEVVKSKTLLEKLYKKAERGYSPTSVIRYMNCSLQFYFHDVLDLRETEEVEETVETSTLGSIIHKVLNDLFQPYINSPLLKEHINHMQELAEQTILEVFQQEYKDGDIITGKNYLLLTVANEIINNYLKAENKMLEGNKLEIKHLEEKLDHNILLKTENKDIDIKLKGIADRIDILNGQFRIIDYKTGLVQENELRPKTWEDIFTEKKYNKSFQLLFYSYLFYHYHNTKVPLNSIIPGIISLRNPSKGLLILKQPEDDLIYNSSMEDFEANLKNIFLEIFNPDIPFSQTNDQETCDICTFRSICNK